MSARCLRSCAELNSVRGAETLEPAPLLPGLVLTVQAYQVPTYSRALYFWMK